MAPAYRHTTLTSSLRRTSVHATQTTSALVVLQTATEEQAPHWATSPIVLISALVVALCVVLLAVALTTLKRHRRQIAALMARLDAVEADGADTTVPQPEAEPPEHVDERANVQKASSDDVLAGRTSYVAAMVDGAGAEAVSLTDQTILCIHAHLDQSLTPGQLAKELRVSLRTLERVVAATLECTPSQLIAAMKMREARRLLISGAFRVSEVAYRLGFASPAHFSTRFKSFYRVSPSQMLAQQGAHEADVLTADNGRGPVN